MGIAERREREKEQRRNDILDAAEKVFFSKGIDKATMDEVAEKAELSKGTLYLYFKSKEELYLGINIRGLKILRRLFDDAVNGQATGLEKSRAIGEAYFQFYQKYENYFNAMFYFEGTELDISNEESFACQCHRDSEGVLNIVAQAIRDGIEDGSIRSDLDPLKTSFLLWAQSTGVIQHIAVQGKYLQENHHINPQELVADFFEFMNYALRAA